MLTPIIDAARSERNRRNYSMVYNQDYLDFVDLATFCSHLRFSDSYSGLTSADYKLLESILINANINNLRS